MRSVRVATRASKARQAFRVRSVLKVDLVCLDFLEHRAVRVSRAIVVWLVRLVEMVWLEHAVCPDHQDRLVRRVKMATKAKLVRRARKDSRVTRANR